MLDIHHQHTQCIPAIEILWSESGERRSAATHTHKRGCGQRAPGSRLIQQNDRSLQQRRISEEILPSKLILFMVNQKLISLLENKKIKKNYF